MYEPNTDQNIIDELDKLYTQVGRIAYWKFHNAPVKWGRDDFELMRRMKELTKYLEGKGYEYDWFKGWTKEMVTTPDRITGGDNLFASNKYKEYSDKS
jgi:hypothetical protein